jgi:hypothetical protein
VHFILHGTPNEISCRAFPLTLKGVAEEWFARFPAKLVDNFKDLGCLFLGQFLATQKRKKNPTCLMSLVQGKDESLKDFMLRFNKEKLMVESPNDQMVLSTLMHGVRANRLLMAKMEKKLMMFTFRQFLDKTKEYINEEELIRALMKSQKKVDRAKSSSNRAASTSSAKKEEKSSTKPGNKIGLSFPKAEPWRQEGQRFTPLNTSVVEVFMEIRRDPTFRWPTKLKGDPRKRDWTKFYEYHDDCGHLPEECITLHQELKTSSRMEGL